MNLIIMYFLIGVLCSFLVDLLQDKLSNMGALPPEVRDTWGWTERIICILLWPYAIVSFIKGLSQSNNEDE